MTGRSLRETATLLDFARLILADHAKTSQELNNLAQKAGVAVLEEI